MNCQQVQDLLPLYVGSDLEESRGQLVAAHVQSCERCSDLAREYRETRQLIQTFDPPPLTDDFYAEMRQSVWQNIENKSTSPAFANSNIIADLFRPRLTWAVATAVLIAVSVIGIYVISRRGGVTQSSVSNQPSPTHATPNERRPTSSPNDKSSAALASSGSNSRRVSVPLPNLRRKRNTIHDRVDLAAVPVIASVSPAANAPSQASDSRPPTYGSSDGPQTPLRLEIQTKNPNIRIIWFAPRDAKSSSPSSRGI